MSGFNSFGQRRGIPAASVCQCQQAERRDAQPEDGSHDRRGGASGHRGDDRGTQCGKHWRAARLAAQPPGCRLHGGSQRREGEEGKLAIRSWITSCKPSCRGLFFEGPRESKQRSKGAAGAFDGGWERR